MGQVIAVTIIFVAVVAALCLLLAWPFIWMWNYAVVSAVTFANPITDFWVGFWLMMFISLFLKAASSNSK